MPRPLAGPPPLTRQAQAQADRCAMLRRALGCVLRGEPQPAGPEQIRSVQWDAYPTSITPLYGDLHHYPNYLLTNTATPSTLNTSSGALYWSSINADYTGITNQYVWQPIGTVNGQFTFTTSATNYDVNLWNHGLLDNVGLVNDPAYDPELARRRALKNERERKIARRRGTKLLVNLLNEMQKADYAKTGSFLVPAPSGRIYRLRKGQTAQELDPNTLKVKCSLCVHLTYGYIAEDSLIANMLAIETDEEAWRKVANISGEIHTHSQGSFADLVAA